MCWEMSLLARQCWSLIKVHVEHLCKLSLVINQVADRYMINRFAMCSMWLTFTLLRPCYFREGISITVILFFLEIKILNNQTLL